MRQCFGIHLNKNSTNYKEKMDKELFTFLHKFNENLPSFANYDNKYLKKISELLSGHEKYYFEIDDSGCNSPDDDEEMPGCETDYYLNADVYIDDKLELQLEILKNLTLYFNSKFNVQVLLCYINVSRMQPDDDEDDSFYRYSVTYYAENGNITKAAELDFFEPDPNENYNANKDYVYDPKPYDDAVKKYNKDFDDFFKEKETRFEYDDYSFDDEISTSDSKKTENDENYDSGVEYVFDSDDDFEEENN